MELRIILEGLTNRFPQMRLAASDEPEYLPNIAFRQPLSLWVNLHGEIGSEFGR
jgi:cytochrome P450